ncbi:MAG: CoA transferase subunit A [Rhizobiales bacterium]|nr:CoA transferase subunit A [Hyphomicrobiales bacterium]
MKLEPITRAHRPKRKEVLMTENEATALIKDGDVVIVGGFGTVNHPMPIIRALIRRKVKNLTVIGAATAGLEIDLLIGAGCVKKVIAPYIGAELYAPIGHCFRRAAEAGDIEIYETTEYLLYSQLDAAARGLGFLPWRGGVGTAIPKLNPDYIPFNDPIYGEPYLAVPALHADWAIIHVGQADSYGNGQHGGVRFGDRLLSRAAERVMLTAERIVPNSEIRKNPWATSIAYADVVVEAPYGSHPYASHGFYVEDEEAIRNYVTASIAFRKNDMATWNAYIEQWVTGMHAHADYLAKLPGDRLAKLQNALHA